MCRHGLKPSHRNVHASLHPRPPRDSRRDDSRRQRRLHLAERTVESADSATAAATFGMQVLGAWTDGGRNGEIKVHNANVVERARIRPYVVCIPDIPGSRQVDVSQRAAPMELVMLSPSCTESERLAGDGYSGARSGAVQRGVPEVTDEAREVGGAAAECAGVAGEREQSEPVIASFCAPGRATQTRYLFASSTARFIVATQFGITRT